MATTEPIFDSTTPSTRPGAELLVVLADMTPEQLEQVLANLTASFPAESLLIASPYALPADSHPPFQTVAVPAAAPTWTLSAAHFFNAYELADKCKARAILMLGAESGSLASSAIRTLANAVLTTPTDLAVPCYDLPPHTGLVNSAILYPLTRALFASPVRFPLAADLGLSLRMAERLAGAAHRFIALNRGEETLWPVNEAAVARFSIDQFDVGRRVQTQPLPGGPDLNTILPLLTGSLFSDIDAKAAFWQRPRQWLPADNPMPLPMAPSTYTVADIAPMLSAFQLAYTNLHEIWSLVLPPNSLVGLKRLSTTDAAALSSTFSSPTGSAPSIEGISSAPLSRCTSHGSQATSTSPLPVPTPNSI
jgi:hypothetical protein